MEEEEANVSLLLFHSSSLNPKILRFSYIRTGYRAFWGLGLVGLLSHTNVPPPSPAIFSSQCPNGTRRRRYVWQIDPQGPTPEMPCNPFMTKIYIYNLEMTPPLRFRTRCAGARCRAQRRTGGAGGRWINPPMAEAAGLRLGLAFWRKPPFATSPRAPMPFDTAPLWAAPPSCRWSPAALSREPSSRRYCRALDCTRFAVVRSRPACWLLAR